MKTDIKLLDTENRDTNRAKLNGPKINCQKPRMLCGTVRHIGKYLPYSKRTKCMNGAERIVLKFERHNVRSFFKFVNRALSLHRRERLVFFSKIRIVSNSNSILNRISTDCSPSTFRVKWNSIRINGTPVWNVLNECQRFICFYLCIRLNLYCLKQRICFYYLQRLGTIIILIKYKKKVLGKAFLPRKDTTFSANSINDVPERDKTRVRNR